MDKLISILLDQCTSWKNSVFPRLNAKDIFLASGLGPKEGSRCFADNVWNQSAKSFLKTGTFQRINKGCSSETISVIWLCIGKIVQGYSQLPASGASESDEDTKDTVNMKWRRAQIEKPIKKEPTAKRMKKTKNEPKGQLLQVCQSYYYEDWYE